MYVQLVTILIPIFKYQVFCVNLYGVCITINEELSSMAASSALEKYGRTSNWIVWGPAVVSVAPASVLKLPAVMVTGAGVGVRAIWDEQNVLKS
jgi:hypothetical protein